MLYVIACLEEQNQFAKTSEMLYSLYLKSLSKEKNNIEYENNITINDRSISLFLDDFFSKHKDILLSN